MATFATLVNWITSAGAHADVSAAASREAGGEFRLRALPNEEIYFWVREVDNSRVIPQTDPTATKAAVKFIGSACLAVILVVGILVPMAGNILAGYRIHALENQRKELLEERAELELAEAQLLSPARLAELAAMQELVDPAPETTVPLDPAPEGELAWKMDAAR